MPDWEESVPNPAPDPLTWQWLNAALMASGGLDRRTIAHAARLQHIAERQIVGDPLSLDPQRSRSDQVDLGVTEASAAAAIVDDCRGRAVAGHLHRAGAAPVLVAGERRGIHDALPRRGLGAWKAADFPEARRGLAKKRRPLRAHQNERSGHPCDG